MSPEPLKGQPHPNPHVGEYDPSLGRTRTHSDDFYDHRKRVQERISAVLIAEKKRKP